MKKVLSQFNKTISVDDLIKTVQAELKAINLSSASCDIQFKNYPSTASEDEGISNDILNSGLNTIVFDTDNNKVIIYITADASLYITKIEHEELANRITNATELIVENQNDITEIEKSIETIKEVNEANKNKYEALSTVDTEINEKIGDIQGKLQTINQKYELANTGINELGNKTTEIQNNLNDYALKTKVLEIENTIKELQAEIEKLKTQPTDTQE